MLTAWTGATTLTATSGPTAAYYTATSSTATSTFAGSLQIGTTTGQANFVLNGTIADGPNILQVATSTNQNIFEINKNGLSMFGTTTPAWSLLSIGNSTLPQMSFWDNISGDVGWAFRSIGGNFYLASSTASATSSNAALTIFNNAPPSLSVGTTTSTENDGIEDLGLDPTAAAASSTIVLTGKGGIQMLNTAGAVECLVIVGTTPTVIAGACTP